MNFAVGDPARYSAQNELFRTPAKACDAACARAEECQVSDWLTECEAHVELTRTFDKNCVCVYRRVGRRNFFGNFVSSDKCPSNVGFS